ncbi:MAG: hypothetical protein ABFS86_14695, partial [Planctomycetota bacterium]
PGRRVGETVRLEDLFPTILEVLDLPRPSGLDGVSLLTDAGPRLSRAVLGSLVNDAVRRDFPDFARSRLAKPLRAVYDGRHHLIQAEDGSEELYDVGADPAERNNLAPGAREILRRMRPLLPKAW